MPRTYRRVRELAMLVEIVLKEVGSRYDDELELTGELTDASCFTFKVTCPGDTSVINLSSRACGVLTA